MPDSRTHAARVAAMLSCALVLTLSACNTGESAPTGEYDPSRCPTGLVC